MLLSPLMANTSRPSLQVEPACPSLTAFPLWNHPQVVFPGVPDAKELLIPHSAVHFSCSTLLLLFCAKVFEYKSREVTHAPTHPQVYMHTHVYAHTHTFSRPQTGLVGDVHSIKVASRAYIAGPIADVHSASINDELTGEMINAIGAGDPFLVKVSSNCCSSISRSS